MRMPCPPPCLARARPPAAGLRAWWHGIEVMAFIVLLLFAVAGGKPRATPAAMDDAGNARGRTASTVGRPGTRTGDGGAVFPLRPWAPPQRADGAGSGPFKGLPGAVVDGTGRRGAQPVFCT